MNISDNIRSIEQSPAGWVICRVNTYTVQIQKADPDRVYNVPGQPGMVYNYLEDAYAKVNPAGYVITGVAGEMWPVGAWALHKYDIAPEQVTPEPQAVSTKPVDMLYAAVQIPAEIPFAVEADYGEKVLLHGNAAGIPHGAGDWVLVPAVQDAQGNRHPDFSDPGRIINGTVFETLYSIC